MELKLNIGFEQLFNLANQLPKPEKKKLIAALEKTIEQTKDQTEIPAIVERELKKYKNEIQMSEDFNEPLGDSEESL